MSVPTGPAGAGRLSLHAANLRLLSLAIALGAAAGAAAAVTYLAMIALQGLIWSDLGDVRWVILPLTILGGALIGWTRLKVRAPEIEEQIAAARSPESTPPPPKITHPESSAADRGDPTPESSSDRPRNSALYR